MNRKQMIRMAKLEMKAWKPSVPSGLVLAILFAFIHRATTGETVEESFFFNEPQAPEYEI